MAHHVLDVRKLLCPLPVIRVQQKIKELNNHVAVGGNDGVDGSRVGGILEVLATDKGVLYDIPAWCRIHGFKVIKTEERAGNYCIEIDLG